jgi:Endodeoxyribonuclease RusA
MSPVEAPILPGMAEPPGGPENALEALQDAAACEIVVAGKPLTWSRTGSGQHGPRFTPADRRARMGDFAGAWIDAGHRQFEHGEPLRMHAEFVFSRPASHYGTGRNAGILKESARAKRPGGGAGGGDLDNLVKLAKDALEGVAFPNDSQIVELEASKRYATGDEFPHSRIVVEPI